MKRETITAELFKHNRRRFARQMLTESVAVFCSNDRVSSNGESQWRFRQNPDLFYLTGIVEPDTVLVLAPRTPKEGYEEVLFIARPQSAGSAAASVRGRRGPGLSAEEAAARSGVARVCYTDELEAVLHELVLMAGRVYVNTPEDRHAYSEAPSPDLRFAERLMRLYPAHKYHRAQPILKQIGMVKSSPEVGQVHAAIDLALDGLRAAADVLRAGQPEFALEAAALRAIIAGGAQGIAHPVGVAAGANALYPGYDANAGTLREGELVQLQIGVTVRGYNASIARVLPVSGEFDQRQRTVYAAVADALEQGIAALVPSSRTLPECDADLRQVLAKACQALGIEAPEAGVHYPDSCYHHVGRHLRDPYDPYAPIQASMVVACAPAIYLPAEGLGLQLRDVVLVTDEGPVDLAAGVPTTIEELEELVGSVEAV